VIIVHIAQDAKRQEDIGKFSRKHQREAKKPKLPYCKYRLGLFSLQSLSLANQHNKLHKPNNKKLLKRVDLKPNWNWKNFMPTDRGLISFKIN